MTFTFKFLRKDPDNCRVYYRGSYGIFCIQDETSFGRPDFKFYVCTKDGEPSTPLPMPPPEALEPAPREAPVNPRDYFKHGYCGMKD